MEAIRDFVLLLGRVFVAGVFIYDAFLLVSFPDGNLAYMERHGVPGFMLWPTAVFQFAGGLAIVAGLATRLAALGFAGFCVLTALTFHRDFSETSEIIQFGKDFGLAGGFLFLATSGAGRLSLDGFFGSDRWPLPSHAS